MFLAWYEKKSDENNQLTFQHHYKCKEGMGEHVSHFHNGVELIFALKGSFEACISGKYYKVNEGDIVFASSFEPHKYFYVKGNEFYVVVISGNYFDDENGLLSSAFLPINTNAEGFARIREFLRLSYENWDEESVVYKRGFANMLLGIMRRYYPMQPKAERGKNEEAMVDAVKYINENCHSDIRLDEISAKFGYTPNYFSNLFQRFMGMKFRDYLNWCRVLLYTRTKRRYSELSAAEAAEMCGFGSLKSLYRARKKYGKVDYIPDYLK